MLEKEDRVKTISFKSFRRTVSVVNRKRIYISILLLVVWGLTTGNSAKSQNMIAVDQSATGKNDGTSWTDAFVSLQDAIAAATAGDCYNTAMCESFFTTLECELLDRRRFKNSSEARMAIFEFIEAWYNPKRQRSSLDYKSPVAFENKFL